MLAACIGRVAGDASTRAPVDDCRCQIIVSLREDPGGRVDDGFVTDLARVSAVQLTFLRAIGPNLYVFSLVAADSDPSCRGALARLRRDPRVRSVDLDERRRAQG